MSPENVCLFIPRGITFPSCLIRLFPKGFHFGKKTKKTHTQYKWIPNWWFFTIIYHAVWNIVSALCCELATISKMEKQITRDGNMLFSCSTWVSQACHKVPREGRIQSMFTFGNVLVRWWWEKKNLLDWFDFEIVNFIFSVSLSQLSWFPVMVAWLFFTEGTKQKCDSVAHRWKKELLWGSSSQGLGSFLEDFQAIPSISYF